MLPVITCDVLEVPVGVVPDTMAALPKSFHLSLWVEHQVAVQEDKLRRQAGLEELRPWTSTDESKMAPTASRVCRSLCFSYVKS